MAPNDRYQMVLRLSSDHMKRLDKAAKYCGQTKQTFVLTAVLAEIAEVEERRRMKQLRVSSASYELSRQDTDSSTTPSSMLIETLRRRQQESEPVLSSPEENTQRQVVVNVGNTNGNTGSGGEAIERLATYVTAGNDLERDTRLRTAVEILGTSASTDEERKVLAAKLDEAIAGKTKVSEGGVVSAARIAFDKLAGLFGGDE